MTSTLAPQATSPRATSRLLASLGQATAAAPTAEKLLIGPDINWGRELLVSLARLDGGWMGWRAANLRSIASDLALVRLSDAGVRIGSDIEVGAIINRALDSAVAAGAVSPLVASLARSLGFRTMLRDAVLELRTGGVTPATLRAACTPGAPARDVAAILERYEAALVAAGVTDPAGVFAAALAAFDDEAPFILPAAMHVAPGLVARGLAGELLARLIARGARPLGAEPVAELELPRRSALRIARELERDMAAGVPLASPLASPLAWVSARSLPAPDAVDRAAIDVDFFCAATPGDEIREVFRRVVGEGLRWDDVEIVASDPDTYGIALDVLTQRLGVGATMLSGIPFARTRMGRALDRWLHWLEDGLPADVLRQMLEAGELADPAMSVTPTSLGAELRRHQVGWGRARYEAAVADASFVTPRVRQYPDESDDAFAARAASRTRTAAGLHALLLRLLAILPPVPERGSDAPVRTTTARLAQATLDWLALVPLHGQAEQSTAGRLESRLAELAAIEEPETSFSAALGALREALADLRAWPLVTNERKPWSAAGGMVHLTDLAHAGLTARRRTFVVGLDADRVGGGDRQDPLLTDAIRHTLGGSGIASGAERRADRAHAIASALAALRGRVTLSYATGGSLDGREAGPAAVLLQAKRIAAANLALSYDEFRESLGAPVCPVPADDDAGALLDPRDVWLAAIADGPLLLRADAIVRAGFPMLDAGMHAAEHAALADGVARFRIGADAAKALDPSASGRVISPSSLELLSKCPLAWLYRNGMSLQAPEDPEYDPDCWLDAADRGTLLHEVYETFAKQFERARLDTHRDAARTLLLDITERIIARWRDEVPPPSDAVFASEAAELRASVHAFLEAEREEVRNGDGGRWESNELEFGFESAAFDLAVQGGMLRLRGRIDRVDTMPDGTIRVIDYKTGSTVAYTGNAKAAPFAGGRHLQPAMYAAVAATTLGKPLDAFEYRFPTVKGEGQVVRYDTAALDGARAIVDRILEHARAGVFVPTDDTADCRFCDYQPICRIGQSSCRVSWAAEHGPALPEYAQLRANRSVTADGEEGE